MSLNTWKATKTSAFAKFAKTSKYQIRFEQLNFDNGRIKLLSKHILLILKLRFEKKQKNII